MRMPDLRSYSSLSSNWAFSFGAFDTPIDSTGSAPSGANLLLPWLQMEHAAP